MKYRVEHSLGICGGRILVERALSQHVQRFKRYHPQLRVIDANHLEVRFEANGYLVVVAVTLTDKTIELAARVPWSLRIFQNTALQAVDNELRRLIAEAQLRRANTYGC